MTPCTVTGWRKRVFDAGLACRIAWAGIRRFGVIEFAAEMRAYLKDNRNLLSDAGDRYVRRGRETYAATALPPLGSRPFLDYFLEEMETFNHRKLSPLVFALLSVSSRCPYRCRYCYALDELRPDEAVEVEALARAVADLRVLGVPNVFLTGGEPMMRKEALPAILEPARGSDLGVWLVSSGWGMDRTILEHLLPFNLKGVVVSLDSADPAAAIESKGHPDAFANAVSAIRAATDLGLLVSTDCMVRPDLLRPEAFTAYVDFVASLGVRFVNFFPPHRVGGAEIHRTPILSTPDFQALEALMNANNRGRANRGRPLTNSAVVWEHRRGCVGGQQFLYVNPLGEIRPCPFLRVPVGNVRDEPLKAIVERMRGAGEQCGCFDLYDGLPARTRIGGVARRVDPRET